MRQTDTLAVYNGSNFAVVRLMSADVDARNETRDAEIQVHYVGSVREHTGGASSKSSQRTGGTAKYSWIDC